MLTINDLAEQPKTYTVRDIPIGNLFKHCSTIYQRTDEGNTEEARCVRLSDGLILVITLRSVVTRVKAILTVENV